MSEESDKNRKRLSGLVMSGKLKFYLKEVTDNEVEHPSLYVDISRSGLRQYIDSLPVPEITVTDYGTGNEFEYNLKGRRFYINKNNYLFEGLKKVFDFCHPKSGDKIGIGIDPEKENNIIINFKLGRGLAILCDTMLNYIITDIDTEYLKKLLELAGIQSDNASLSLAYSILQEYKKKEQLRSN